MNKKRMNVLNGRRLNYLTIDRSSSLESIELIFLHSQTGCDGCRISVLCKTIVLSHSVHEECVKSD